MGEGLDNLIMVSFTYRTIAGRRQGRYRGLKGRIVSDRQAPVRTQTLSLAITLFILI